MHAFDLTPPTDAQRRELTHALDDEERRVLLNHGTEAPFCGVFLDNKKDGVYTCRFCGLPLFRSNAKFDSGTGWPSFFQPFDERHNGRIRDASHGMIRARLPGRTTADARTPLSQFGLARLHRGWRCPARPPRPRRVGTSKRA
jgi:peptide-methionine (R)-S-oxide reductase